MATRNVHLNGRIVPADQAAVGIFDAGLLHGASVFTTMLGRGGAVFRLERHLERLLETAEHFHLSTDATPAALTEATRALLVANELSEARMRITLTPGAAQGGPPTTLVTAEPLPPHPRQWYQSGLTVCVSSFRQNPADPTAGYKTGCYLPRMLARQEAAARGADEALWFTTDNLLAEACFCNVFVVLDGRVLTPPLTTPVLPGVVRQAVIELCGRLGIACDDSSSLTVRQMLAAQEMFLTSSPSGVRPVARVERHGVGDEKPGEVTRRIMAGYREMLDQECPGSGSER